MTPFLQAENLSKRFGDQLLFENISFTIFEHWPETILRNSGKLPKPAISVLVI